MRDDGGVRCGLTIWGLSLGIACGGAPNVGPPQIRKGSPPPADVAVARAQLERYSPKSHAIVKAFETLPREWKIGRRTHTATTSIAFDDFIEDGAAESAVSYLQTAVHEVYHGYSNVMGYKFLAETGVQNFNGLTVVHVEDEPILIVRPTSFPSRDIVATYPAAAHTMRFKRYVSEAPEHQSTQASGVFGLLDEYAAYYHDARTAVDLWPWVRGAAPATYEVAMRYTGRLFATRVPHAEFKFFILHYLWYAREHRPQVYQQVMANEEFGRAFTEIDDAYTRLVSKVESIEPGVHQLARQRGVKVEQVRIVIDDSYPAVLRLLETERYRAILAELRQPR